MRVDQSTVCSGWAVRQGIQCMRVNIKPLCDRASGWALRQLPRWYTGTAAFALGFNNSSICITCCARLKWMAGAQSPPRVVCCLPAGMGHAPPPQHPHMGLGPPPPWMVGQQHPAAHPGYGYVQTPLPPPMPAQPRQQQQQRQVGPQQATQQAPPKPDIGAAAAAAPPEAARQAPSTQQGGTRSSQEQVAVRSGGPAAQGAGGPREQRQPPPAGRPAKGSQQLQNAHSGPAPDHGTAAGKASSQGDEMTAPRSGHQGMAGDGSTGSGAGGPPPRAARGPKGGNQAQAEDGSGRGGGGRGGGRRGGRG
jgi:translation initiation factor IF-2